MTTITVTIDGNDSRHSCDATVTTPHIERKYAAILLAALDATVTCLEGGDNYENVLQVVGPYLQKRKIEMRLPNEN